MDWEEKGKQLVTGLNPVYKVESEEKILKSIMSILYHQNYDIDDAEKVMITVYDSLPNHSITREDAFKLLENIFIEKTKPNGGVKSLEDILTVDFNRNIASKAVTKVKNILIPEKYDSNTYHISDTTWISIDTLSNKVDYCSLSFVKNEAVTNSSKVLLCRPVSIIIHINPLAEGKREFTITWQTVNNTFFTTKNVTLSEIENQLFESGYVLNNKHLKVAITAIIQIFIDNKKAEIKNEIQADGFYYNKKDNKLDLVGYDLKPVVQEEVMSALDVIEDLSKFFVGVEGKLATTLKHALIAPFGFAKKQMNLPLELLIPYVYHFGRQGSGKTTIARIGLWFYQKPVMGVNDIGGTEFDTVPRIGEHLRKSTFGIIVNEPETSLMKRSCAATLKTTVERTNSRQKIRGNMMEQILALAMVSFASNDPLPNYEGLPRRFVQLVYTRKEEKSDEAKEKFMEHFRLDDSEECLFNKLQYLANFVVNIICDDVDLLRLDWKSLSNNLIEQAYDFCELECPKWLLKFTDSVTNDDLADEELEDIRMFFLNEINKAGRQVKVYSAEDGRPLNQEVFFTDTVKNGTDFEEKVWNIINEGLIPYMVAKQTRDGVSEVCFLSGLKKILNQNNINCYSLASTAELLEWDYSVNKINGKSTKCMKVSLREFLQFIYPNMGGV